MADVGRSTAAHVDEDDADPITRVLDNWGRWQKRLDEPLKEGYGVSPMFREYVAGYREVGIVILPECPESAMAFDAQVARLSDRHVYCLCCNYILSQSSRNAARTLSYLAEKVSKKQLKCSHETYRRWLSDAENSLFDAAEQNVAMMELVAEKNSALKMKRLTM